jgi:hypothetical protein
MVQSNSRNWSVISHSYQSLKSISLIDLSNWSAKLVSQIDQLNWSVKWITQIDPSNRSLQLLGRTDQSACLSPCICHPTQARKYWWLCAKIKPLFLFQYGLGLENAFQIASGSCLKNSCSSRPHQGLIHSLQTFDFTSSPDYWLCVGIVWLRKRVSGFHVTNALSKEIITTKCWDPCMHGGPRVWIRSLTSLWFVSLAISMATARMRAYLLL